MPYPGTKRGQRSGSTFNCLICGKEFYRLPSQIKRGLNKTCGKECKSKYLSGPGNPFWGKTHSTETRQAISSKRKGRSPASYPTNRQPRSPEALQEQSERMKRVWREQREKMLAALPRGEAHHFHKPPELRRYRTEWTPMQRREWIEPACKWCGATDNLTLDHILPIFMGGGRYRENCQTLCICLCNTWKLWHVEVPMWHSLQAVEGAKLLTNP